MGESSILTDGEPVRLVCLSVHHKNIGMFMTHDFKAHVPPPLHNANSHRKRGRRFGNNSQSDIFCAASHPRAASRVQQRQASLPGLNKGGNKKILCKETYERPAFSGMGTPLQPASHKILSRIGSFLISKPARSGIGTSGRVTTGSSRCNLMRAGAAVFAVDDCLTVAKDVPTVEGSVRGTVTTASMA